MRVFSFAVRDHCRKQIGHHAGLVPRNDAPDPDPAAEAPPEAGLPASLTGRFQRDQKAVRGFERKEPPVDCLNLAYLGDGFAFAAAQFGFRQLKALTGRALHLARRPERRPADDD